MCPSWVSKSGCRPLNHRQPFLLVHYTLRRSALSYGNNGFVLTESVSGGRYIKSLLASQSNMTVNTNTMSGWKNDVKHMHIYLRTSTWWAQLNKPSPNQSVKLDKLLKVRFSFKSWQFLHNLWLISESVFCPITPTHDGCPSLSLDLPVFLSVKKGSSFPLSPSACSHRVVWLLGFSLFTLKYKAHLHDCFVIWH